MTTVTTLVELPLFQALGWSLLHFIWQGLLVAILLLAARFLLRDCGARPRYHLACAAMLLMLILPLSTAWLLSTSSQVAQVPGTVTVTPLPPESNLRARRIDAPPRTSLSTSRAMSWQTRLHKTIDPLLPWLIASWLTGVVFLSLKLWGQRKVWRPPR